MMLELDTFIQNISQIILDLGIFILEKSRSWLDESLIMRESTERPVC